VGCTTSVGCSGGNPQGYDLSSDPQYHTPGRPKISSDEAETAEHTAGKGPGDAASGIRPVTAGATATKGAVQGKASIAGSSPCPSLDNAPSNEAMRSIAPQQQGRASRVPLEAHTTRAGRPLSLYPAVALRRCLPYRDDTNIGSADGLTNQRGRPRNTGLL
jgi:hypothetical protein